MIKALIRKELREQIKLAALWFVVFTVMVFWHHRAYGIMLDAYLHNYENNSVTGSSEQPLISGAFLSQTDVLCALFGLCLGFLQVRAERTRDLLAFLIHRPASRTTLFLAKVATGLGLYLLAAGIPLGWLIGWSAIPGNVAAPFEWGMAEPVLVFLLIGVAVYFAAMLMGLRQVRWFGSRPFAIGMAILIGLAGINPAWPGWLDILAMLIGIAILATAAWTAFQNLGHHEQLSLPARLNLALSLLPGAFLALGLAAALSSLVLEQNSYRSSSYFMSFNGSIYKVSRGGHEPTKVVDLDGKPPQLPNGYTIDANQFANSAAASMWYVRADPLKRRPKDDFPHPFYTLGSGSRGIFWCYWNRYGRMVRYDVATRQMTGTFGPAGFATNLLGSGDRFGSASDAYAPYPGNVISTPTAIYQLTFHNLTAAATPLFATDPADPIVATQEALGVLNGAASTNLRTVTNALGVVTRYVQPQITNIIVVTSNSIQLLNADGNVVWKLPHASDGKSVFEFRVCFFPQPGQYEYALWQQLRGQPDHITWINHGQVVKTADLPILPAFQPGLFEKAADAIAPSPIWITGAWLSDRLWDWTIPWDKILRSLILSAVLFLPLTLWLGQRYRLGAASQLGWALFNLVFGLAGFLAFLSVHQWPAREKCPNCKKPRLVTRERCEHCQAEFPPPEKTGVEIFEPLGIN